MLAFTDTALDLLQSTPDIAVVIVTFNSGPEVIRCLASVMQSVDVQVNVTVVDNNSADDIPQQIARSFPTVRLIQLNKNLGFACAVNIGIREARSHAESAPFVLVLNPDTTVDGRALRTLLDFAEAHPRAAIVAPLLTYPDGANQLTARAFPTAAAGLWGRRSPLTRAFPNNRWSTRFLVGRDATAGDPAFQCDWVSGACMLVSQPVLDQVGLLDERYFLFWEDADWCKRMADHGYEVWTVPSAVVGHSEGGSRRGWPSPVVKSFHRGAYLYWRTHIAPQWWNPLRWFAAVALQTRSAMLIAFHRLDIVIRNVHLNWRLSWLKS